MEATEIILAEIYRFCPLVDKTLYDDRNMLPKVVFVKQSLSNLKLVITLSKTLIKQIQN